MRPPGRHRVQNMRRLILILLLLTGGPLLASAETLRLTTWNLNWFPSGSPDVLAPEVEARTIQEAAAVLRSLDSDVIILQEVRDPATCDELARALGTNSFRTAICSSFREGATPSKRQIAILTKYPVESSWAEEWTPRNAVSPPGGFVFASVRAGAATVAIFGVHLKNNLAPGNAEREIQFNILKREVSTEQLMTQVERLEIIGRNEFDAFIVAGNFNTCADQSAYVSERTLPMLRERGFRSGFEDVPLAARITCPGRNRYPATTFDYVFTKHATLQRQPLIISSKISDHFPVTCELEIATKPLLALEEQAAGASLPLPLPRATDRWVWFPLFLLLGIAAVWLWRRQRLALSMEMAVMTPGGGVVAADESGLARTAEAEQRAARANALVRSGLLPHLARLMTDTLVRRLLWQRTQWLESQQATAVHVTELERRLSQLQPKLQARLDAYEKRIAELEGELENSRRNGGK